MGVFIFIFAGLLIIIRLFKLSVKIAWRLIINSMSGAILLLLINFGGKHIGIELEMTTLNCFIAGVFGIPGILLLLILR